MAVQPGRDEEPELIKHERRGYEESRYACDFQIEIERVDGIEVDEFFRQTVFVQHLDDGALHDIDQAPGREPTADEADDDGDDGIDDALAKLLEMIEEAHGGHGFFGGFRQGRRGGRFRHRGRLSGRDAFLRRQCRWRPETGQAPSLRGVVFGRGCSAGVAHSGLCFRGFQFRS